jgi:hypothetical protein
MACMHPDICPFLCHRKSDSEVVRVQIYKEALSAQNNIPAQQARIVIGLNHQKAIAEHFMNSTEKRKSRLTRQRGRCICQTLHERIIIKEEGGRGGIPETDCPSRFSSLD